MRTDFARAPKIVQERRFILGMWVRKLTEPEIQKFYAAVEAARKGPPKPIRLEH